MTVGEVKSPPTELMIQQAFGASVEATLLDLTLAL